MKYTYCSVLGDHGFSQTIIVKIDPTKTPDGVPLFDSPMERADFLRNKDMHKLKHKQEEQQN